MSTTNQPPLLLRPSQLKSLLDDKHDVAVLDATWFMPNSPRNGCEEFLNKRIPGARFLDLDKVASSHPLGLKHMMPSGRVFADACESFGINPSSHVVIYDTHGVFSSPRALFMFRSFGHSNSSVLDGGLPMWESESYPLESGPLSEVPKTKYPTPEFNDQSIRNYDQIVKNASLDPTVAELVLDARSRGRYLGADPEPRPGLSSGHIPNSLSLPFSVFMNQKPGNRDTPLFFLKNVPEIQKALEEAVGQEKASQIIKGEQPVITSCGSGMTAGILWLGLRLLGADRIALYDESWTGYAMRTESKIVKD
ncbi:Rhodanese-like protein [Dendrothele bispora CBS 962.96]|uniref:Rhodanese-like protein n=1 Tax=Dendrothele bispora (strain CBS 962.96) TaxID=1314807 RepID=A0A4S8MS61_DENBC|nr:Rhodanese-like protein [Dendrothele bispora CBS 962.96]